jgi:hypothetical protein
MAEADSCEFEGLNASEAVARLDQIRGFLVSFRQLTRAVESRIDPPVLKAIGNTDGGMQTIGFTNIPLRVEGTILKQEYQLTQARYELAQLKFERGQTSSEEVGRARAAYQAATARLQQFWDVKLPTD